VNQSVILLLATGAGKMRPPTVWQVAPAAPISHAVTYARSTRLNTEAELTTLAEKSTAQPTDRPKVEPVLCI